MLIRSPPHWRYILLSALVENWGPSITTRHLSVKSLVSRPSKTLLILGSNQVKNPVLKGSPNAVCATIEVPSKKLQGLIPLVRSMIWVGRTNDPGETSSRREPTAENARMARTPKDFSAAILAREGTVDGLISWPVPCRAMKATRDPDAREEMTMGDEGYPQGYAIMSDAKKKN